MKTGPRNIYYIYILKMTHSWKVEVYSAILASFGPLGLISDPYMNFQKVKTELKTHEYQKR